MEVIHPGVPLLLAYPFFELLLTGEPFGEDAHGLIGSAVRDQQVSERHIRVGLIGGDEGSSSVVACSQALWIALNIASLNTQRLYRRPYRFGNAKIEIMAILGCEE